MEVRMDEEYVCDERVAPPNHTSVHSTVGSIVLANQTKLNLTTSEWGEPPPGIILENCTSRTYPRVEFKALRQNSLYISVSLKLF